MSIYELIRAVAADLDTPNSVYFGTSKEQNTKVDQETGVIIYINHPIVQTPNILPSQQFQSVYELQVLFAKPTAELDQSQDAEADFRQMQLLAHEFVRDLKNYEVNNKPACDVSIGKMMDVYQQFDALFTGTVLSMRVTINETVFVC
jgi:hypothetical protein